jgi:hypothetical protein
MADRLDDSGLAEATTRLVEPPPFDALRSRARKLRRRNRLAALTAAAVVTAAVATGALLADTSRRATPHPVESPSPTPVRTDDPSPLPKDAERVEAERLRALSAREIVAEGRAAYFVVNEDGVILTYWHKCGRESDVCVGAFALSSESGPVETILQDRGGWPPIMKPAGHGFLVSTVNLGRTFLLSAAGSKQPVYVGDPPLPIEPGHVAVRDQDRFNVVDPQTGNAWALLQPAEVERIDSPVIDDTGRVWAIGSQLAATSGANEVVWSDAPEGGWHLFRFDTERNLPGQVIVQGDHVLATSVGDGATIAPVERFAVSSDRGATWTVLDGDQLPFRQTYGLAATDDGTLFVSDYEGRVWRSVGGDWTRFARLPDVPPLERLEASGATVLGMTGTREPQFVRIDDGGSFSTFPAR